MKIYKSKNNKQFRIVDFPKPAENEVIYLTRKEYDWIKEQNFTGSEFDFIHQAKIEDHMCQIIPDCEIKENVNVSEKYSTEIINMLKGRINKND